MSLFYSSVKRLAALRLRLSHAQGKLKFAIRRRNKAIALNAIFEIEALEGKIEQLQATEKLIKPAKLELELTFVVVTYHQYPKERDIPNTDFKYLAILDFLGSQSCEVEEHLLKKYGYFSVYNDTQNRREITALCCDLPVFGLNSMQTESEVNLMKDDVTIQEFTVHNEQLIDKVSDSKNINPTVAERFTVHAGQLILTFEAYLESLQLPVLDPKKRCCNPKQVECANHIRSQFLRENLYKRLEHDPSHPLLVFAPSVLKTHPFNTVDYWIAYENKDYAVAIAIHNLATNKYHGIYPVPLYKGEVIESWIDSPSRRRAVVSGYGKKFFFCKNRTMNRWEVWHYLKVE